MSSLLEPISAVRLKTLKRRLQAEREMLNYCFEFDHIYYSHSLSHRQVYLRSLEANNRPAISHLQERSFGELLYEQPFSAMHEDLVTEIFNDQTKRQAEPRASVLVMIHTVND